MRESGAVVSGKVQRDRHDGGYRSVCRFEDTQMLATGTCSVEGGGDE